MLIQETKKILEKHLGRQSVHFVDERNGIFRCTKDFEQHPYQVLYVDCSNVWSDSNFGARQLEDYQGKTLLKDYYSDPGALQWNYYYAFISKSEEIHSKEEKKKAIESDELYTRKLVLSPKELDEWLSRIEDLSKPSQSMVEKDLGSIWIQQLQKNKLDAVFLDTSVAAGIKHYMEGKPVVLTSKNGKEDGKKHSHYDSVSFIEYLKLDAYRPHPEIREFNFGRVNLIKGVNGAGKTSLLESIELLLCGKSFRNPDEEVSGYNLQARLKGSKEMLTFTPENLKVYKHRDKIWYNNAEQRFNRLHISFNKYNFYNSDAAFLLSNNPDKADVKKAFEDIALGEDINRIESRLLSFKESFAREYRLYSKSFKDAETERKKEEKLLKDISRKDQDPERFLQELVKEAKASKWIAADHLAGDKFIPGLEKDLTVAKTYIQTILSGIKWSDADTSSSIEELISTYKKAVTALNGISKEVAVLEKLQSQNDNKIEKINEVNDLMKELSPYYRNKQIAQLPGLSVKIQLLKSELVTLRRAKKIYTEIDKEDFNDLPATTKLNELLTALKNQVKKKEGLIRKLAEQQKKLTSGFNQLEKVIAEIKGKGKEYLHLNPDADECPLCHSSFEHTQLVRLIERSKKNIASSRVLDDLQVSLRSEKKTLDELNLKIENLDKLLQLSTMLFGQNESGKAISVIWKNIAKLIGDIQYKEEENKKLTELADYFNKTGLDENSFSDLSDELTSHGFKVKDAEDFGKKELKVKNDLSELKKKAGDINDSHKKLEIKRAYLASASGLLKKNLTDLPERFRKLQSAAETILLLKKLIEFKDTERLSSLSIKIEKIQQVLLQYKEVRKQKQGYDLRLKSTNERIKEMNQKEKANKALADLAQNAYTAIDDILITNGKSDYLQKFIERNKAEIVEIFKMIHSPKEFDNLTFSITGNVSLRRKHTNRNAPLTQISTGQRSALSLSVFSALNRKLKNGPNILLFDDPVMNVDDLNVLSYFDYLREVAINGNRQVFFATANDNVAFLFSQKFKFLGSEFVTIDLTR